MNTIQPTEKPSNWIESTRSKARFLTREIMKVKDYVDTIGGDETTFKQLSTQIYEKLEELYQEELPLSYALDMSDLVFKLEGPAISEGNPRASMIANQFNKVRTQVVNVAKAISEISKSRVRAEDIDLGVVALVHGSLIFGFTAIIPSIQEGKEGSLLGEEDPIFKATRQAIRNIGVVTRYIDEGNFVENIEREIPDPAVRDATMVAVEQFSPSSQSGIDSVSIGGKGVAIKAFKRLTPKTRNYLRNITKRPVKGKKEGGFVGIVREIDLDARRCQLRGIKEFPNLSLRIAFDESFDTNAKVWLDKKLEMQGTVEESPTGEPRLMMLKSTRMLTKSKQQDNFHFSLDK